MRSIGLKASDWNVAESMHPHVEGFRIAAVIDPLMMDRWTVWSSVSPSGHPRPFKPRRFACKMRPDLHTICIRLADQTCFFRRLPPPPPQWIPAQGANFVADFIRFRRNFIRIPAEFHPDSDGISSGFRRNSSGFRRNFIRTLPLKAIGIKFSVVFTDLRPNT